MRIYYKPISFRTETPTVTTPFLTEGVVATSVLPALTSVAGVASGQKLALHNVCGEVSGVVASDVTVDFDSTFAEPVREPVDNDMAYSMTLDEAFEITEWNMNTESALANKWEDPYNSETYATITGRVAKKKYKSFMTNEMILAASPIVIIEDCDGNLFRCARDKFSVTLSRYSADYLTIKAQVSSNFKPFILG